MKQDVWLWIGGSFGEERCRLKGLIVGGDSREWV